jgi:hypothetical protein
MVRIFFAFLAIFMRFSRSLGRTRRKLRHNWMPSRLAILRQPSMTLANSFRSVGNVMFFS